MRLREIRRLLVLTPLLLLNVHASAQVPLEPTYADLVYNAPKLPEERPQRLDLYLPESADGPVPLLIYVHGGGWLAGDKAAVPDFLTGIPARGIALASVNYRFSQYMPFPAQIHDVKGAVRWLRAHADEFGLDSSAFGAVGESAGGHLVALLGTSAGVPELEGTVGGNLEYSSAVDVVADFYGPTDLMHITSDRIFPPGGINHDDETSVISYLIDWDQPGQGLGDVLANLDNPEAPYPQLRELLRLANPISHVGIDDPPFMIAHGTVDTQVSMIQSIKLVTALESAGVPVDYLEVPGKNHEDLGPEVDAIMVDFLVHHLRRHPGDANFDGHVDILDLLEIIVTWGPCPGPRRCPADLNGDDVVDTDDLLIVLLNW